MWTCEEARFTEFNSTIFDTKFPQCQTLAPDARIIADANLSSDSLVEQASALRVTFGAVVWIGFAVHVLATEVYVRPSVPFYLDNSLRPFLLSLP